MKIVIRIMMIIIIIIITLKSMPPTNNERAKLKSVAPNSTYKSL